LSYYMNQDDIKNTCRGSINLRKVQIWTNPSIKQRFDIVGTGSIRYRLKASDVDQAQRWIKALNISKKWIEGTLGDDLTYSDPSIFSLQTLNNSVTKLSNSSLKNGNTLKGTNNIFS